MNRGWISPFTCSLNRPSGLARKKPSFHPAVMASCRRLARESASAITSATTLRIWSARSWLSHFSPSIAFSSLTWPSRLLFRRSRLSMRCRRSFRVGPASALAGVASVSAMATPPKPATQTPQNRPQSHVHREFVMRAVCMRCRIVPPAIHWSGNPLPSANPPFGLKNKARRTWLTVGRRHNNHW